MLSYCKVFTVQFLHLTCHHLNKPVSICNQSVYLIFNTLKLICNFKFKREDRPLQSNHIRCRSSIVHAEKFKISAKIKDIELVFIFPIHKSRTKSGTTTYHLPEFCFTHNLLEKYKVQYFRHINTCIQHIYRYRNLWHFLRI